MTDSVPSSSPVSSTRWFDGKAVLVTGAASGIGCAAAQRFAAEGAAVCLADLDQLGLERVTALLAERGSRATSIVTDISDPAHNRSAVEHTIAAFGKIDVAYLNAGYLGPMAGFAAMDLAEFDRIIRTNLYGCFHGLKALYPHIEANGAIVVTSSTAGIMGLKENPAYSASKHGMIGLVKSAAAAFAAKGVRVNLICPGGVATPMAGVAQADAIIDPADLVEPPYAGMSSAQHVAELALFLASSRASAITGACHVIDAGLTVSLPTGG